MKHKITFSIILSILLLSILLPLVSAGDFTIDNYKTYDSVNKVVKVYDYGQLGTDTLLVEAQLKTPQINYVMRGEDVMVAEFSLNVSHNDYDNLKKIISNMKVYDLNNDWKGINREMKYKLKEVYYEEVNQKIEDCSGIEDTSKEVCKVTGYKKINLEKVRYVELDYETKLSGEIILGIFTEVKEGDNCEWIFNLAGENIIEWAIWQESFNTNLISYHSFNIYLNNSISYDSLGLNNGTFTASTGYTNYTAGLIGNAGNFESGSQSRVVLQNNAQISGLSQLSVNAWIYPSAVSAYMSIYNYLGATGTYITIRPTGELQCCINDNCDWTDTTALSASAWNMVTCVYDGGSTNISVNGGFLKQEAKTGAIAGSPANIWIGADLFGGGQNYFNGKIDELGVWSRSLSASEITTLYNGGVGMTYTNEFENREISATQSYPINKYNTTSTIIPIGCNFTANVYNNISSVKLNVYDSSNNLDYTNTDTGDYGVSYNKSWTTSALTDDTYSWACYGYGDGGMNASTTNRTFTIDSTSPTISIFTPTGNQGIQSIPYNVTLNYTASDTNLQSCYYNSTFNATKSFVTCNITNITSITNGNTNRIYVYANDSFGNSFVNYSEFYPSTTYSNATFNAITTEGAIENFKLYIVSSTIPTINSLIYNGTAYNGNIVSLGSNNYIMNNSISIPLITSQQNVSFLWNITFADSSTYATPYYNQTINNFGVDNCTSNSVLLFNFSMYDEDSKAFLSGSADNLSVKLDLNFYNYGTSTLLLNYSNSVPYTNPVRVCLASQINSTRYTLDGLIQYSSLNRFPEFYNIQSYTIDNSSYNTNIPLYDLNTSTGTEFKITYKDSNFIPVTDALIYIQRKYIEDGIFRTVELPKTGADGTALGKFVRNDAIYNLIFVKNGVTLATFSDIIPVCQNPTVFNCEINLNSLGSGTIPSDYSNVDGLSFTMTYNKTTRTVSSTYSITSGVPEWVSLNLTVNDALGTTIISSDSLNSAGGTLSANIPEIFGNGTVTAKLYKSNAVVGNALINIYQDPSDIYGGSWIFIALFCIIFIVGMAVSDNPMVYGASLVLGFAMLIMMNIVYSASLIGVGATILYLVIGIIIIMMKGSERN